jgi:putative transposase
MEAEVAAQIGAELGERTPDRVAQRNGYRPRSWDTRVGELELRIPRLRTGSYFPSFLEPRRRAEQALVAVVQEAYVNGVSTRRVDRLVEPSGCCMGTASHRLTYSTTHGRSVLAATALIMRSWSTLSKNA